MNRKNYQKDILLRGPGSSQKSRVYWALKTSGPSLSLSKEIVTRLLKAMEEVMTPTQHCAIPGRNISTPLPHHVSLIDYASHKNIEGYMLSTDIFKAYDRTNLEFITETMRRIGFKTSRMSETGLPDQWPTLHHQY